MHEKMPRFTKDKNPMSEWKTCGAFLALLFTALFGTPVAWADEKMNVLFIAVDDLRPELATYGAQVQTPHFDKFASTGLRFDRAYCQQAVCGASRLSLLGGLYPTKTNEQTFHVQGWRQRLPDLITINQHFIRLYVSHGSSAAFST